MSGPAFERVGDSRLDALLRLLEEAIEQQPDADAWGDPNGWPDGRSITQVISDACEEMKADGIKAGARQRGAATTVFDWIDDRAPAS